MTLSILAGVDAGTKELELAIAKEAKGLAPRVQTTEAQTGIPQTIQRLESPPVPEGKEITMEEALEMVVSDPSSGLPAFLARFDSLEFNSLPTSRFHCFGLSLVASCDSLCLLRACHSWRDCSKLMGTSLVGSREACFWATS